VQCAMSRPLAFAVPVSAPASVPATTGRC